MTEETLAVLSPADMALMRGDVRDLAPLDRALLLRRLAADASLSWGASPPVIAVPAQGRLVPYITKAGADALAAVHGVSVIRLDATDAGDGVLVVEATVRLPSGRRNMDAGTCAYDPAVPESRARARMVATTRARRRAVLGIVGSGFAWIAEAEQAVGAEDVDETAGEL